MAPKKKVTGFIKLQIQAGAATPAPPVGPALGQHGVNIMEFVKAYNAATEAQKGQIIPVEITVYEDRSFTFITKTPPASRLILKAAGVDGKYVTEWAGGSANVREFSARFIKPVIVPAGEKVDLTVVATVTEVDGNTVKLDITATSAGVKVLGMAKAVVVK